MQYILLATLLFFGSNNADLQTEPQQGNRIAVSIEQDSIPTNSQFQTLLELGIFLFETDQIDELPTSLNSRFFFLLRSGSKFTTPYQINNNFTRYLEDILERFQESDERFPNRIVAVSVFEYPYETNSRFQQSAAIFTDSLQTELQVPLYFRSLSSSSDIIPSGFQFVSNRVRSPENGLAVSSSTHFIPGKNERQTLISLEKLLNESLRFDDSLIILPSGWLLNKLEENPDFQYIIQRYLDGESVTIPLPNERAEMPSINWSVILLFLIWISFVVHYKYQPIYSQSAARYFTNHTFFVTDIKENRLRNPLPGIYLLLQHTLITGLFFVVSAQVLFSENGLQILAHHFPSIIWLDSVLGSLFLTGIILALILQSVSILWIYLLNNKLRHFSQVINLYSWPLHINLLSVTLLVMFNQVGLGEKWVMSLGIIFGLVWFFSFNIAAIDGAKFLDKYRVLNLLATVGLHVLIGVVIIWFALFSPSIFDPFLFALSAP